MNNNQKRIHVEDDDDDDDDASVASLIIDEEPPTDTQQQQLRIRIRLDREHSENIEAFEDSSSVLWLDNENYDDGVEVEVIDMSVQHESRTSSHLFNETNNREDNNPNLKKDDNIPRTNQFHTTIGLSCPECSQLVDSREYVHKHLMEVHGKVSYMCPTQNCFRRFDDRNQLDIHSMDHSKQATKWTCGEANCTFETTRGKHSATHWSIWHEKGCFQCSVCPAQYPFRNLARNHYRSKHDLKRNSTKKKLKPQIILITEDCLKKCTVEGCSFSASYPSELKDHQLRLHTDLRPFECAWTGCGFTAQRKRIVLLHVKRKHFNEPIKKVNKNTVERDANEFVRELPYDLNDVLNLSRT